MTRRTLQRVKPSVQMELLANDTTPWEQPVTMKWSFAVSKSKYSLDNKISFSLRINLLHRLTSFEDNERIQDLEQEQEKLTGSLLALTSHFGQVQFRLKQIIE